jgi:hypothetical protein
MNREKCAACAVFVLLMYVDCRDQLCCVLSTNFKLLRCPGIDSKESIPTLFLAPIYCFKIPALYSLSSINITPRRSPPSNDGQLTAPFC